MDSRRRDYRCCRRYIANVIVGEMREDSPGVVYLLNCKELKQTSNATISQLVLNSLQLLWPEGIKFNSVLLFLSDAAAYMKKAVRNLLPIFPRMIHLTCLAHGLNRLAEKVRDLHPDVDKLIAAIKQTFVKAPSRRRLFKEMFPDVPLPPNPVITRWGTWIEAVVYYATNFESVQTLVQSLDERECNAIAHGKQLMSSCSIRGDLTFISSMFSTLPWTIAKLENSANELAISIKAVMHVKTSLQTLSGG